jgi:glycerol-3-phosphate dehydrogenase
VTLLGTTATQVPDPDNLEIPTDEVDSLLRLGAELLPAAATARVLRAFAGVRPLYKAKGEGGSTRDLPRTYVVIDHLQEHGVPGLVSVVGGKFTTFREMAEKTVDVAARQLGVTAPCRTADEPILPPPDGALVHKVQMLVGPAHTAALAERHPASMTNLAAELAAPGGTEIVCECEQVMAGELLAVARELSAPSLSDIRRRTRLGMGTCQGAFCGYRAALLLAEAGVTSPGAAPDMMLELQAERWGGVSAALPGPEMRGAELTYALYTGLFGGMRP